MTKIEKCLLCGDTAVLKHSEFPGYQEPDTFKIYHCQNCNTAFSLPRVETNEIYDKIYKNAQQIPGYDRYWEYAQHIKKSSNPLEYLAKKEDVYWGVKEALSSIFKENKSPIKILEIGSGLGYLTFSLIKSGYDVIGLDISQKAVNKSIENFGEYFICCDLFEYSQLHSESFDIVIITEVIEHIAKPLDFIESTIKLLKQDGQIIITTPNKSFCPLNIIWATDLPPVHCWWFSEDSMKYISKRLNTNIRFINFRKYYKSNYRVINLKPLLNNQLPKYFFDKNGDLIRKSTLTNKTLKTHLRFLITQTPFVNKIYFNLKKMINPNIIICKDRGCVLCAILQKL